MDNVRQTGCLLVTIIVLAFAIVFVASAQGLQVQDPTQAETTTHASAAQASSPLAASTLPPATSDEYVISPEDILDVYIYDVPELSRDYLVNALGNITVPLLPEPVHAAGLNTEQIARLLEERFRQTGRLSRPEVTVTIKQSRRSVVSVEGAVKLPQVIPVVGRTKLIAIIAQCGGLADDHGSTITIVRGALARKNLAAEGEWSPSIILQLKNLMAANDPVSQFDVWPGDRVTVERAGIFYVLGQVVRPGGYNLKSADEQITVLEALSIAGDVTSIAKTSKVRIIRKVASVNGGRQEIALNVDEILSGRTQDQVLRNNDILYVPASGGKRTIRALSGLPATVAGSAGAAAVYSRF